MCARDFKSERGSISVEAAICGVGMSFLFFFMLSLLQYMYVYCVVSGASVRVAQEFSCYSSILHESGLASFSDTVKNRLLEKSGINDNDNLQPLVAVANSAFDTIDEAVYSGVLKSMVEKEIASRLSGHGDLFEIDVVDLSGSEYFQVDNEFKLTVNCRSKHLLPVPFFDMEGYSVKVSVKGNAWISGGLSEYNLADINVWSLDNFKRGNVLEKLFGSNLPYSFPVIDILNKEEKTVTVIRSIDHTKKTYMKSGAINDEIMKLGRKLLDFTEGEYGGVKITKNDYKKKKLLLIMPIDAMTASQQLELAKAMTDLQTSGIIFEVKYYQASKGE